MKFYKVIYGVNEIAKELFLSKKFIKFSYVLQIRTITYFKNRKGILFKLFEIFNFLLISFRFYYGLY